MYFLKQLQKTFQMSVKSMNLENGASAPVEQKKVSTENISELDKKITEIKKQLSDVEAGNQVVGTRKDIMERGMDKRVDKNEQTETDVDKMRESILKMKTELHSLQEQRVALQRTLETMPTNKLSQSEIQKMQSLNNKEFLQTSPNERLKFITNGNVDANDVATGKIKNVEFTFTFDGKFNKELYVRTTAGQVLPDTVREVESGGQAYTRRGINGEFFNAEGRRLLIHEKTEVTVSKLGTEEEMKNIQSSIESSLSGYEKGTSAYEIALNASKKGIDPKFVNLALGEKFNTLDEKSRQIAIEDFLTDIARIQDDYVEDYGKDAKIQENGKVSEGFAGYILNTLKVGKIEQVASEYGYDIQKLKGFRRTNNPEFGGGPVKMENINIENIGQEELKNILSQKKFTPGSAEAQVLFTAAAQSAGLPTEWGKSYELHRILGRESNGVVGRLNYTINGVSPDQFKQVAVDRGGKNPLGTVSSASGLGQLLLSNVDKYYPDGRNGIGDPLNEAVGMLRYIKDRYGSPDVAGEVYGKVAMYTHAGTGKMLPKNFQEGY